MANQYRPQVTPKGVENIFRVLCESDPRCGAYYYDALFLTEGSSEARYPAMFLQILSSDIVELGNLYYTKWEVELWALTLRRKDRENESDAINECQVLLNDTVLRLRQERQFKDWGFRFESKAAEIRPTGVAGRDDVIGGVASIVFLTPLVLCGSSFPADALPDVGLFYSASTVSVPSTYLTCSTLENCEVIQTMRSEIDAPLS